MFDIAFSELAVIGVVALIVIGPERLPKVARTAGHLLGRAQRYINDVKADINREIQLEELKKLQSEMTNAAHGIEDSVRTELDSARSAMEARLQGPIGELETLAQSAKLAPPMPTPDDPPAKSGSTDT